MNISAVILAKNEEKNIVDCIESVNWCDQIIVIDDYSEDRTEEIAKINKAEVYKRYLGDDFSKQRNFGLSKCKHDWVLFIDADERISQELRSEIKGAVIRKGVSGFYLKRKDILWGKTLNYGEAGNMKLLRLARKDAGFWSGNVHEEWKISGKVKELNNPLTHFPHQGISEFLSEINFYTDIRAKELSEQEVKASLFQIIFYPVAKFVLNYIFKRGFKDGIQGIILAYMMSLHSFLVRGKLWLKNQNS